MLENFGVAKFWQTSSWCLSIIVAVSQRKTQARNQLGTPGVAKSFLRRAQIFLTMSNSFQLCSAHFPGGRRKIL